MTPDSGAPPSIQAPSSPRPKIWTVGTLVYSTTGIVVLFSWLVLGDFAWWMRDRSVGPMAAWYLSDLQVPNVIFGLLITSLPAVIQFVVAPIVSVKSDRYRSRLGRRIPFLIVTTIIAMFSMLGLGLTPIAAGWLHELGAAGTWLHSTLRDLPGGGGILSLLAREKLVAVGCFAIFWTLFEVAQIAGRPIFDGLVNDVVPRPLIGRFFGLFRAVGLIDGMIFNFWIMGLVPSHFTLIMTVAGVIYGTSFIWVCLKVKEGEYPPPPPREDAAPLRGFLIEVRRYCRECFSQPFYLSVFALIMTAGLCFMPFNIFSLPYARHMGVDMGTYGKAVALSYFISFCFAYPLGWMADRFHPLRMAGAVLVVFIGVMAWGSFYAQTPQTFLVAFVLHQVISGCYYTSAASTLQQHLFPRRNFAQFSSAAMICDAVSRFCLAPVMGLIIDQTHQTYRYTFVMSVFLAAIALVVAWIVYARFKQFGGPDHYVAPEPDADMSPAPKTGAA